MWKAFKYFILMVLLIVVLLGVYVASEINNDIYTWHEKLTLEVETPEGLKTASSVQKIVWRHSHGDLVFHEARGVFSSAKGEAAILEIVPGKYLFALFKGARGAEQFRDVGMYYADLANMLRKANPSQAHPHYKLSIKENVRIIKSPKGRPFALSKQYYPLLVTFKDINDPTSVQQVDPDNFAATFGPDIKLKSITLEITDEPVTTGKAEKVLGWFYNVDRIVPKSQVASYYSRKEPIPSKGDFISYSLWRKK